VKDPRSPEASHVNLVKSLHDSAVSLGIRTLAEGLETASSIAACEQIGFELYQGYAFGRPAPLESLLD
jgi:EAL domain-containing protein (putative c-di-GMP-specific phosphodiesterase class I)